MPVEYKIIRQRKIVYTRAWGKLTNEEALSHQHSLKVDPDFDPKFGQLVDFSEVDDFKITPIGIQMLVSRDPWDAGARRAFVAPSDISFGMLRMHEFLMDDKSQVIAVFRSAIEAWRWLGCDRAGAGKLV